MAGKTDYKNKWQAENCERILRKYHKIFDNKYVNQTYYAYLYRNNKPFKIQKQKLCKHL